MQTTAAIADGFGRFRIEPIEVALPKSDEVLVKLEAAGICHTDHASMSWKRPLVMGHEGAGIVCETGAGVTHVKPGDRVVLNWCIPCGRCFQCDRGDTVLCESSKPAHIMKPSQGHAHAQGTLLRGHPVDRSFNLGTLAGLTLVRKEAVTPIPSNVSFAAAAISGCGVRTGFGSVVNIARIQAGESVVVMGCGGVGLNIIQSARIARARKIIAIDSNPSALERAWQFGASDTIAPDQGDAEFSGLADRVRYLTEGRGADYAFEATSCARLAFVPLLLIRDGGTALQVSGINENVNVPMPWFMWNKHYITPLYGGCQPARDFPKMFEHYSKGELKLNELITRTYALEQMGDAIDDMMAGRNAKGVILFE